MPKIQKVPTAPFNPGYGCIIFVIITLTFSGMIGWSIYSLLKQDKEISKFTVETTPALPPLSPTPTEKDALRAKLEAFATATSKNEAADLSLSLPEMNNLLVLAEEAKINGGDGSVPYVDMLRFQRLDPAAKRIFVELRMTMNKLPWQQGKRYLVGTAVLEPAIDNHAFALKLDTITVPGKTVPEGFLNDIRMTSLLSVASDKPAITTALGKVSSFDISPDGTTLTLHATPAKEEPKPAKP